MLDLDKLNPEQKKAALHKEGPLLILAGAGSGKTATMTCRIANLIINEHVSPYNILAVTFTNKAAGEMRERVEGLVGSDINMWIMTFHAACLRILRKHADLLGYTGSFAVYDPSDQKTVAKDVIKELDLDPKKYSPAFILSVISKCKERMLTPDKYLEEEEEKKKQAEEELHRRGLMTTVELEAKAEHDEQVVKAGIWPPVGESVQLGEPAGDADGTENKESTE